MLASRIIQIDTFWLARPDRLKALISDSTLIDVKAFYGIDIEALSVAPSLFVNGSVAHIDISGYMIKKVPLIWKYYDIAATSTDETIGLIKEAFSRSDVKEIHFHFDTPGGSTSGSIELADFIYANRGVKPMIGFVNGACCSAGIWTATQLDKVYATRDSEIGSIGVFTVLYDDSKLYEKFCVKAFMVKFGDHKGVGAAGVEINEEDLVAIQNIIDNYGSMFVKSVSRARGLTEDFVMSLADGTFWLAKDAFDKKLIDGILEAPKMQTKDQTEKTTQAAESTVDVTEILNRNAALAAELNTFKEEAKKKEQAYFKADMERFIIDLRKEGKINGEMETKIRATVKNQDQLEMQRMLFESLPKNIHANVDDEVGTENSKIKNPIIEDNIEASKRIAKEIDALVKQGHTRLEAMRIVARKKENKKICGDVDSFKNRETSLSERSKDLFEEDLLNDLL